MPKEICIIGFGEMGKRHAKDLESHSDGALTIAGVYEPSDESYESGAAWLGHRPARFRSVSAMLGEIAPDGAVIATPNSLHLAALQHFEGRRIPLILEKPLDTSLDKVREIVAFAESYEAPIMVHHVMRYSPIVARAKAFIEAGAIGRVAGFQFTQNAGGHIFHNFRRTFATGGGQLLEKATHDFDLLLYLTGGMPQRVSALCRRQVYGGNKPADLRCRNCDEADTCPASVTAKAKGNGHDTRNSADLCAFSEAIDIFDLENCLIELDNDIIGTYSQCFFAKSHFSRRYELHGTEGWLSIDFSKGELQLFNNEQEETYSFDYEGRIHYNGAPGMVAHFRALVEGKESTVRSPVRDAYAAELIAFAAYRSNEAGAMVSIEEVAPLVQQPVYT